MKPQGVRHPFIFAIGLILSGWVGGRNAFADVPPLPVNPQVNDPYDVPLAPRPPTLPELTHRDYETGGETTFGVVTPNLGKALSLSSGAVVAIVQRVSVEVPVDKRRRFYVGSNYEIAGGSPPGGGAFTFVPSNLELYGRAVWAARTGLTFGGGTGVLLPTAQFSPDGAGAKVAGDAQTIRPWDNAFFLDDALTVRGFVDVRDVDGPFVLQFREGLEWSRSLGGAGHQVEAIAQLYIGYRVLPLLGVGIEAFETYLIYTPEIVTVEQDAHRSTFTISPSIRLMTPYVQPALGFVTSIGTPLFGSESLASGSADGFWALRLGASIVWDPWVGGVARGSASATLAH